MRRTHLLLLPLLVACAPATEDEVQAFQAAISTVEHEEMTRDLAWLGSRFRPGLPPHLAAAALRDFVQSQLPCSTVQADEEAGIVVVDFGALEDGCTWRGRTWTGVLTLVIQRDEDEGRVEQYWEGISDGTRSLDGAALVTWEREEGERRVVHEFVGTGPRGSLEGSGDRSFQTRSEDPDQGVVVEGWRSWTRNPEQGEARTWHLELDELLRLPGQRVPVGGSLVLTTPQERTFTFSFELVEEGEDAGLIRVTVDDGAELRSFLVTPEGERVD